MDGDLAADEAHYFQAAGVLVVVALPSGLFRFFASADRASPGRGRSRDWCSGWWTSAAPGACGCAIRSGPARSGCTGRQAERFGLGQGVPRRGRRARAQPRPAGRASTPACRTRTTSGWKLAEVIHARAGSAARTATTAERHAVASGCCATPTSRPGRGRSAAPRAGGRARRRVAARPSQRPDRAVYLPSWPAGGCATPGDRRGPPGPGPRGGQRRVAGRPPHPGSRRALGLTARRVRPGWALACTSASCAPAVAGRVGRRRSLRPGARPACRDAGGPRSCWCGRDGVVAARGRAAATSPGCAAWLADSSWRRPQPAPSIRPTRAGSGVHGPTMPGMPERASGTDLPVETTHRALRQAGRAGPDGSQVAGPARARPDRSAVQRPARALENPGLSGGATGSGAVIVTPQTMAALLANLETKELVIAAGVERCTRRSCRPRSPRRGRALLRKADRLAVGSSRAWPTPSAAATANC